MNEASSRRDRVRSKLADLKLPGALEAGDLRRRLRLLARPALLIVDEIGYLPMTETGGRLFFQLVSARHERSSTVLTTNKGFEEWG